LDLMILEVFSNLNDSILFYCILKQDWEERLAAR